MLSLACPAPAKIQSWFLGIWKVYCLGLLLCPSLLQLFRYSALRTEPILFSFIFWLFLGSYADSVTCQFAWWQRQVLPQLITCLKRQPLEETADMSLHWLLMKYWQWIHVATNLGGQKRCTLIYIQTWSTLKMKCSACSRQKRASEALD